MMKKTVSTPSTDRGTPWQSTKAEERTGYPRTFYPRLPGGYLSLEVMSRLLDVTRQFPSSEIRVIGDQLAIQGLSGADLETVETLLGVPNAAVSGPSVRPVSICARCHNALQDSVQLGLQLDRAFYGLAAPAKVSMGVSGCARSCSSPAVKDIGLRGGAKGYTVLVGGSAGTRPRIGRELCTDLGPEAVLALVGRILRLYRENAKPGQRMGDFVEAIGWESFRSRVVESPDGDQS